MKKYLITAAIVLSCTLAIVPRASAQTASLVFTNVPASVLPGSSFTATVTLNFLSGGTFGNAGAVEYWLWQATGSGNPFSITNRNNTGSLFTTFAFDLIYPQLMTPINRNPDGSTNATDLGALSNPTAGNPSGNYFLANITFAVSPSAVPGSYQIGNTTGATPGVGGRVSHVFSADGSQSINLGQSFNITVIPEPSTFALLGIGLMSAGALAYRRRAVARS